MTTPTTNPVPSNSPLDLLFNAEKLDEVVNATTPQYIDRFGVARLTAQGATDTIKLINARGAWVTGTAYASKDLVQVSGTWYVAVVAHTAAATFATDSAKWRVYQGVTAEELAAPTGASLVGYMPAGIGAVATTVEAKQRILITPEDFGILKDGSDETTKIQAWLNAGGPGRALIDPLGGTMCFSDQLVFPKLDGFSFKGSGPFQTVFKYIGGNTNIDLIEIGDVISNVTNVNIGGFRITSDTLMTGGRAIHFMRLSDSFVSGVIAGGMDTDPRKLWDGIHFNGVHVVDSSYYAAYVQNNGIEINGIDASSNANIWLAHGYADFCSGTGLLISGGVGGVFCDFSEFLGNGVNNVKIDNSRNSGGNREVIFGTNTALDGIHNTPTCLTIDAVSSPSMSVAWGGFMGSAALDGVNVVNMPSGTLSVTGPRIFNCLRDGVRVSDATTNVIVGDQCSIDANFGYGINATVSTTNITSKANSKSNSLGDFSANVRMVNTYTATVSSGTGSLGGSQSGVVTWRKDGTLVYFTAIVVIGTNGTGSGQINCSLPFQARPGGVVTGRAFGVSGKMVQGMLNPGDTYLSIRNYDNSYPASSGESFILTGVVEVY